MASPVGDREVGADQLVLGERQLDLPQTGGGELTNDPALRPTAVLGLDGPGERGRLRAELVQQLGFGRAFGRPHPWDERGGPFDEEPLAPVVVMLVEGPGFESISVPSDSTVTIPLPVHATPAASVENTVNRA